ncbi:hypothetical protein YB2330_000151 [Saitoella coloradoensis]
MDCFFLPICCQMTDQNPCRIKIVGPTLGFIIGICAAIICWPLGLLACIFCMRDNGNRLFGYPVSINAQVSNAIPF